MGQLEPIEITAHLRTGFAAADPWSPAIDGILAYFAMRARLGPEAFAINQGHDYQMGPVTGLPLEVVEHGGWWWYAASSPRYELKAAARRPLHRRFDQAAAERHLPDGVKKVQTAAGAYKNARMHVEQRITDRVVWHVVGDGEAIAELLEGCTHVGAKCGAGFGRVRRWSFAPGDAAEARRHRPVPEDYAEAEGIEGEIMDWGIRPPVRIPMNRCLCVMPPG